MNVWTGTAYCAAATVIAVTLFGLPALSWYRERHGDQRGDKQPCGDLPGDTLLSLADSAGVLADLPLRPAVPDAWTQIVTNFDQTAPEVTYHRTEQQP